QDLAVRQLLDALETTHDERAACDDFSTNDLIQCRTEWILAKYTDHNGSIRRGKRLRWPVDELREVEEEDGLNLRRRGRSQRRTRPADRGTAAQKHRHRDRSHAI